MRSFWPQQRDDRTGVTEHLNRVAKYAVSTSLDDPGWDGTTVLRGGDQLEDELHAVTEAPGRDIVLTGSITLAARLLQQDLVDELRLFVHPVVLGHGRRLFPDGWTATGLQLLEQQAIHDVTLLRYAVPRSANSSTEATTPRSPGDVARRPGRGRDQHDISPVTTDPVTPESSRHGRSALQRPVPGREWS